MAGTPFEEKLQETLKAVTKNEEGKYVIPEETDPAIAFAARAELRRRDTQASYTKSQQTLKALQAENEKLAASWEQDAMKNLTNEEKASLEELKIQDPDAWREEINKLEANKREQFQERRKEISAEASKVSELERRQHLLAQYNEENPEFALTDDVIENDIPPRITNKLKNNEVAFEDFLEEVREYLSKGKTIQPSPNAPNTPNLTNASGGSTPSQAALAAQSASDYATEVF